MSRSLMTFTTSAALLRITTFEDSSCRIGWVERISSRTRCGWFLNSGFNGLTVSTLGFCRFKFAPRIELNRQERIYSLRAALRRFTLKGRKGTNPSGGKTKATIWPDRPLRRRRLRHGRAGSFRDLLRDLQYLGQRGVQ